MEINNWPRYIYKCSWLFHGTIPTYSPPPVPPPSLPPPSSRPNYPNLSNGVLDMVRKSSPCKIYNISDWSMFYVGYTASPYIAEKLWRASPSAAGGGVAAMCTGAHAGDSQGTAGSCDIEDDFIWNVVSPSLGVAQVRKFQKSEWVNWLVLSMVFITYYNSVYCVCVAERLWWIIPSTVGAGVAAMYWKYMPEYPGGMPWDLWQYTEML